MSEQDPELGPEEEQLLRALLADLGSTGPGAEPLPVEVADRLDETLAGLLVERPAGRSRRRPRLAVAAAAVVVLGLGGLAAAVQLGRTGPDDSSTAGSGVSATRSRPDAPAPTPSPTPSPSGSAEKSAAGSTTRSPESSPTPLSGDFAAALPSLSSARFGSGVTALLGSPRYSGRQGVEDSSGARTQASTARPACAGPALSDGATVTPVTLDSAPAALVVHPAQDGTRLVEAWSCDGTHRLASTAVAP